MTQRKRILHVFSSYGVGGVEVRAAQLMNYWGDQFEHGIVSSDGDYAALKLVDDRVSISVVDVFPPMKGHGLARTVWQTGQYLRHSNWDMLATYNWGSIEAAFANQLIGGLPHIHHEDGFSTHEPMGNNVKRAMFRRLALQRTSALVVPSSTLVEIARNKWGFSPPFVQRINNGVDLSLYHSQPDPGVFGTVRKNPDDIWIGCISGLRPEKNVRRLVRVAAPLLRQNPKIYLVICGAGIEAEVIQHAADELGVSAQVHMMGFQAHPHRYVGLFDVLAIPSDTEQFPISQVEAMAAGCAICGTDVGDVKLILPPASHPFIVSVDDEAAFTRQLELLVKSASLRADLGAQNLAHVKTRYSFASVADTYLSLYHAAMNKAG
jgi:L-malate glycosyltransferase